MAGSYSHCVNDDGTLRRGRSFLDLIENLGDATEAIEEMYGMIWYLANGDPTQVEEARENYKMGIEIMAPGEQKARW